jgi:Tfp pilus assembly PilM family ATPase
MSTKHSKQHSRKQAVLVEIGSEWLKIAQFEKTGSGLILSKLHLEKFESVGADLTQMIEDAYKKHKFAKIPVIGCLPRKVVNIRMVDLPSSEVSEIEDMVELQVRKLTPYSKAEILSDYVIMGATRAGYAQIMLVIVQRAILRQRYAAIEAAGLKIEKMSLSSEGLLNWGRLNDGGGHGASILLDIGASNSELAVISEKKLAFTRGIMMGANALKKDFDGNKEQFVREINRSVEMLHSESGGVLPERLILTGAGVDSLEEYLNSNLDLPVTVIDGLTFIKKRPATPDLTTDEYSNVSLTALAGAALAPDALQFNLVPDVVRMRKDMVVSAKRFSIFVMMVMTVLVTFSMFSIIKISLIKKRHQLLQEKYEATLSATESVEEMRDLIKIVNDRENPRYALITIVNHLHDLAKGDLNFHAADLDMETKKIILGGTAGQSRDIRTLVNALEQSQYFESVKETGATVMDRRTGRYKFELVCMLEKAK